MHTSKGALVLRQALLAVALPAILLAPFVASAAATATPRIPANIHSSADLQAYFQSLTQAQRVAFLKSFSTSTSNAALAAATPPATAPPAGLSVCPDPQAFNSVAVSVSAQATPVAPGSALEFKGTVTNTNPYPVVGATVYAKVLYLGTAGSSDVVDFLSLAGPLTLKAKESKDLSFSWKVPVGAEPGSYRLATYVVASGRFDLEGLLTSDIAAGNAAGFAVFGKDAGSVRFVRSGITADGRTYLSPTLPPGSAAIAITDAVRNSTAAAWNGSVSWQLYDGTAFDAEHLLDTKTENISVAAGATSTVSYTIADTSHSTYYLVARLSSPDGVKSVIDIPISRGGVGEPVLKFVGANGYPSAAGTLAIACFQAGGPGGEGSLSVRATSAEWYAPFLKLFGAGTFASASYSGSFPAGVLALTAPFKSASANFDVTATLVQNGKTVDQVTMPYRCTALSGKCGSSGTLFGTAAIVLLICLVAVLWYRYSRRAASTTSSL